MGVDVCYGQDGLMDMEPQMIHDAYRNLPNRTEFSHLVATIYTRPNMSSPSPLAHQYSVARCPPATATKSHLRGRSPSQQGTKLNTEIPWAIITESSWMNVYTCFRSIVYLSLQQNSMSYFGDRRESCFLCLSPNRQCLKQKTPSSTI